ncbi:hypothetical protein D3C80_1541370 [compost metagenome]
MEKTEWWNGFHIVERDDEYRKVYVSEVVGFTGKHYVSSILDIDEDGMATKNESYSLEHIHVKDIGPYGHMLFSSRKAAMGGRALEMTKLGGPLRSTRVHAV